MTATISAVVYSRDEAHLLAQCLPRLTDFDEVVVCDMASSDGTRSVAARWGARVVAVPDAPVVEEVRQLGLEAATGDWVLFVDADEHLPAGFRNALGAVLDSFPEVAAVRLRYDNEAFGRRLAHTLQGSAKLALLRRGAVHYEVPARAHVPPRVDGVALDAPAWVPAIAHLNFRGVEQTTEKILRYAANDPARGVRLGDPVALVRELLRATVFNGAWRDGRAGFAVGALHVFGQLYATLLQAERDGTLDARFAVADERRLARLTSAHGSAVTARDHVARVARPGRR